MAHQQIVVIGTSAGGIEALRTLVAALPADFGSPVCIVMHMAPQSPGVLHEILARSAKLPVSCASNLERLQPGHIYVSPPNVHLLVEPGTVRLSKGPRENRFRPAVDPLFRSAAQVYGPGAIGVILTGNLDDGTAGLDAIKRLGGKAVVQDPADAMFPSMPLSAIQHVAVDHVVPLADMAALLVGLIHKRVPENAAATPPDVGVEVNIAKEHNPLESGLGAIAEPSTFACPECNGVLLQLKAAGLVRFRCHTGHAYSLDSLLAEVSEAVEVSLWSATRALQEAGLLLRTTGAHITTADKAQAEHLLVQAEAARRHAGELRRIIAEREPLSAIAPGTSPSGPDQS